MMMEPNDDLLLQVSGINLTDPSGRTQLLNDISFSLKKGDRIAIIGHSGSGKTTLLRLINRLQDPTSGIIKFESQPLNRIPVIKLRQQVVLVPQEPKLLGMTVQEALAYPLKLQQLSQREIQTRIDHWREKLLLPDDWLERNELQLSVGQRQLVSIVRGLVMQPKLLLLDEPTSALDGERASHLIQQLITLTETSSTAIIMVNHQLKFVEKFSDKILKINQGKLVE